MSKPGLALPSASGASAATTATSTGSLSSSARRSAKPGTATAGPVEQSALDGLGALLHPVEVQRVAHGVGELVHALLERRARQRDDLGIALDLGHRRDEAHVAHPHPCVLEGQRATLGQRGLDRRQPARGGTREQAARLVGDRDVDETGDVDVEDRARGLARRQRAHHAEGGEIDAFELEPGVPGRLNEAVDHLAADGDDHDALARPRLRLDQPERHEVEDRLVHRHRDVVGRRGLDGGGERLVVLERRQVERAHDDALVGHAQADALGQVVLLEERLQGLAERDGVGDLAVAQDARAKLGDGAAADGDVTVDADLSGRDVGGVEIEPDDRRVVLAVLLLEHDGPIGPKRARL